MIAPLSALPASIPRVTLRRGATRIGVKLAQASLRNLRISAQRSVVKPFLLADIGEGTTECQIIQWFVQPGARVEQFDKLCEVQSDKAATDITSPFDGIIKKLHYGKDDVAAVGKPLVDIDVSEEPTTQDTTWQRNTTASEHASKPASTPDEASLSPQPSTSSRPSAAISSRETTTDQPSAQQLQSLAGSEAERRSFAIPGVRHLSKKLNVKIAYIEGSGRDGRVTTEDVHRHVQSTKVDGERRTEAQSSLDAPTNEDRVVPLTPAQTAMSKTMTKSLSIPHFLYTTTVDLTYLTKLRHRLNERLTEGQKLTTLPFVLKAVSRAFERHPLLNASLQTSISGKPELTHRATHNFGIAVDTASGLLVPVVRNVAAQSVAELALSIRTLSSSAHAAKLRQADFHGATFTVSNIGSIGGGVVAPVIVEPQVAILGMGRSKIVPAFGENGELVKKEELVLSWSADHRVVDGAECARAAETVKAELEHVETWVFDLR